MPATNCRASRPTPSATARAAARDQAVVNAGGHADLYGRRRARPADEEDGISLFWSRPAPRPGRPWLLALVDGGRGRADAGLRVPQAALPGAAPATLLEHATGRGLLALCAEPWARWTAPATPRWNICARAASSARPSAAGAAAPHGRSVAGDRAGAFGGDQRRHRARPADRRRAQALSAATPSAGSARWWPRKASSCTAASA